MNSNALLIITTLLPLFAALGLLTIPRGKDQTLRGYALVFSLLTFAASLLVAGRFNTAPPSGKAEWVPSFGLSFSYGIDSISLWLILLTTFLMPLVILGSFSAVTERAREFYFWLLMLETAMIGTFIATDVLFFYICFEFTLLPLYFLIGIFGSKDRLRAARIFFLYTFTGSMLTFAGVMYVAWFNSTLKPDTFAGAGVWTFDMQTLYGAARQMSDTQQAIVLFSLLAGFAVKVPIFPVHTWLPLAHTEAPTAGSVILAGVLLKLGTYGLLRFAIPMTPIAVVQFAPWIGTFAIIGILYTALICWVQKDIKKLVAYSSVSHLGFCVLGMFALNTEGMGGSVLYMINHGLSTGALFLCIGMIYERFHTREMSQINGLARVMPVWSFFMVFFCLASVGLPGLNGFVGEFLTLLGAFKADAVLGPSYALIAGTGMILGAIYILYMLGRVVWGATKVPAHDGGHGDAHGHHEVHDLNLREIVTLVPLAVACLVLGLFPTPMLKSLEPAIEHLAAPAQHVLASAVEPQAPRAILIPADSARSAAPASAESSPETPTTESAR